MNCVSDITEISEEFLAGDRDIMVMLQNASALTRNMLEYLGVMYLDVCNFLSKYTPKKFKKKIKHGDKKEKKRDAERGKEKNKYEKQ